MHRMICLKQICTDTDTGSVISASYVGSFIRNAIKLTFSIFYGFCKYDNRVGKVGSSINAIKGMKIL